MVGSHIYPSLHMVGILKAKIHNKKRLLFLVKQLVLSRFVLLDNELSHLTGHQVSAFCFIVIPSSRLYFILFLNINFANLCFNQLAYKMTGLNLIIIFYKLTVETNGPVKKK